MIYGAILGCEIGFWVFLLTGLVARYALRLPRVGATLLALVPAIDLVLLVVTVIDLRHGGTPDVAHGLAVVYLGVSVAWGRPMVRWTDARFAYRFAGGPPPTRPPRWGAAHARRERRQWYRHALAFAVAVVLSQLGALVVGDDERAAGLMIALNKWSIILIIDFFWSFSYTVFPRKVPSTSSSE